MPYLGLNVSQDAATLSGLNAASSEAAQAHLAAVSFDALREFIKFTARTSLSSSALEEPGQRILGYLEHHGGLDDASASQQSGSGDGAQHQQAAMSSAVLALEEYFRLCQVCHTAHSIQSSAPLGTCAYSMVSILSLTQRFFQSVSELPLFLNHTFDMFAGIRLPVRYVGGAGCCGGQACDCLHIALRRRKTAVGQAAKQRLC